VIRRSSFAVLLTLALAGGLWLSMPQPALAQGKPAPQKQLEEKKGEIEQRARAVQQKKLEAQKQEKKYRYKWWQAEKQLEQKQQSLRYHERTRSQTINNMDYLSHKLDQTEGEALRLSQDAASRMRNLYMGERTSLLQMILEAKDIATLLDRIYYKKKIVEQDKNLLESLRQKMEEIKNYKTELAQQKVLLDSSIQTIQVQKNIIAQTSEAHRKVMERYTREADVYERMERELLRESANITSQIRGLIGKGPKIAITGSTGMFIWPIRGAITSRFGYRRHPIHRKTLMHTGLDIAGPNGGGVAAADGGQVIFAGWKGGYGKAIMINHGYRGGKNLVTLYGHLSNIRVKAGQMVNKGEIIGNEGSTGNSTGPHLHFEIRENGAPIDPYRYL